MVGRVAARRSSKSVRSTMRRRRLKRSFHSRAQRGRCLALTPWKVPLSQVFTLLNRTWTMGSTGIGVFAAVPDDRVVAEAVGEAVVALQTIGDDAGARLGCGADKAAQIRRGGGGQDGDAGAAGDKVALLDALAPPRRDRDGFDSNRHQALIRIGEAAAPALRLAAATIIALIDLDQAVERVFRPLAQPVA